MSAMPTLAPAAPRALRAQQDLRHVLSLRALLREPIEPGNLGQWLGDIAPYVQKTLSDLPERLRAAGRSIALRFDTLARLVDLGQASSVQVFTEAEWLRGDLMTCVRALIPAGKTERPEGL